MNSSLVKVFPRNRRMGRSRAILCGIVASFATSSIAFGGFQGTELFLPAVGNPAGGLGSRFYTTVWITNLGSSPVNFTFDFLKEGQANTAPESFSDTLGAGQTRMYDDVVTNNLKLTNSNGGARITATGEIFASERIYNQPSLTPLSQTAGQFFSALPRSFAIGLGQSTSIQGVYLGSGEDFRYNFALLEVSGHSCIVHVQALDSAGSLLGALDVSLQPYEQNLIPASALAATATTSNARILASVTSGAGTVILAGSQVGNGGPQDQSGFEMSFRDDLLGSSVGLNIVTHDASLFGDGTTGSPLGVNPAAVVTSLNGLHGAVALAAGSNVSITPSGQTLTIAAAGGGGGSLTLPYSGTTSSGSPGLYVTNTGSGSAIQGTGSGNGAGIYGNNSGTGSGGYFYGTSGEGVVAQSANNHGVEGDAGGSGKAGIYGSHSGNGYGVFGISGTGTGVYGVSGSSSSSKGVIGVSVNGTGVLGSSSGGHGVEGDSSATGVNGAAVYANSTTNNGIALFATNNGSDATVVATNASNGVIYKGFSNGGNEVFEVNANHMIVHTSTAGLGDPGTIVGKNDGGANHYIFDGFGGSSLVRVFTVEGSGALYAAGPKNFVSPDPEDPSQQIVYTCLEGPESGTYFRGTGHVVHGFGIIDVPGDFRDVTSPAGLTVVATPVGSPAVLTVMKKGLEKIVIQGSADVEFDYIVNGVRAGYETHATFVSNRFYVPPAASAQLERSYPAGIAAILKKNGTLNPDGSVNLETAHRLGWDKQSEWRKGTRPVGGPPGAGDAKP